MIALVCLVCAELPDFGGPDVSSVRHALCGGATVPPSLVRRVEPMLDGTFSTRA